MVSKYVVMVFVGGDNDVGMLSQGRAYHACRQWETLTRKQSTATEAVDFQGSQCLAALAYREREATGGNLGGTSRYVHRILFLHEWPVTPAASFLSALVPASLRIKQLNAFAHPLLPEIPAGILQLHLAITSQEPHGCRGQTSLE